MTPIQQTENNLRFISLEKSKTEHQIRNLNGRRCEAMSIGNAKEASRLNEERAHAHYVLTIIRIAKDALEQLQVAYEERARIKEMLDDELTDVESEPSPVGGLKFSVVSFDRPRSPGSFGIPD